MVTSAQALKKYGDEAKKYFVFVFNKFPGHLICAKTLSEKLI